MLHVDVNIPSNALVSQYKMVLVATVKAKGKKRTKEFVFPKDVFILFNSWCEGWFGLIVMINLGKNKI